MKWIGLSWFFLVYFFWGFLVDKNPYGFEQICWILMNNIVEYYFFRSIFSIFHNLWTSKKLKFLEMQTKKSQITNNFILLSHQSIISFIIYSMSEYTCKFDLIT